MEVWKMRTPTFLLTAPSFSPLDPTTFLFCVPHTSQEGFMADRSTLRLFQHVVGAFSALSLPLQGPTNHTYKSVPSSLQVRASHFSHLYPAPDKPIASQTMLTV